MNPQCARCGKVVYPTEKVNCLDKVSEGAPGQPGPAGAPGCTCSKKFWHLGWKDEWVVMFRGSCHRERMLEGKSQPLCLRSPRLDGKGVGTGKCFCPGCRVRDIHIASLKDAW